jgi:hypothetical protein
MKFQWDWIQLVNLPNPGSLPKVLNVGCADDPLYFGEYALHFDIDNWGYKHMHFVQGDGHYLPFAAQSFDMVICGDVLEHALYPLQLTAELCRVSRKFVVMTIFMEWKLPDYGQFVEEGQHNSDIASRELGFEDRIDYQVKNYPQKIPFDDERIPHLIHINQFSDEMIHEHIHLCGDLGFTILQAFKGKEPMDSGHPLWNWMIAAKRLEVRK